MMARVDDAQYGQQKKRIPWEHAVLLRVAVQHVRLGSGVLFGAAVVGTSSVPKVEGTGCRASCALGSAFDSA